MASRRFDCEVLPARNGQAMIDRVAQVAPRA